MTFLLNLKKCLTKKKIWALTISYTMIKKFARFILLLQLFEGRTIQTPWYNHKIYFCALVTLFLLKMSRRVLENSSLIGNVCIAGGLRKLLIVLYPMNNKTVWAREWLCTFMATETFLPMVKFHVFPQTTFLWKWLGTLKTTKRFFPSMNS